MEKQLNGIGRRKAAVTRVFVTKGEGKITINDKDYKTYFPLVYLQNQVERPMKTVDLTDKYDVKINATGGGGHGDSSRDSTRAAAYRAYSQGASWNRRFLPSGSKASAPCSPRSPSCG